MAEHVTSEASELYALGVLDGDERTAFEEHLRSCEDCTRGVASAHQRVALIGLACLTETPRPTVREKIMRRILAERAGDWSQERTVQISELRVEREPEPEPAPIVEPEPEPEPELETESASELVAELAPEETERRVPWIAAGVAVLVLTGTVGLWMMHRSHEKQSAALQPQAAAAQQNPEPQAQPNQNEKAALQPKEKARAEANHAAAATVDQATASAPAPQPETLTLGAPARIQASAPHPADAAPPPSLAMGADFGGGRGAGLPGDILPGSTAEPQVKEAAPSGPVRVSEGVATARLIEPIRPVYPEMAREAHVQGTVVVDAMITKTGRIRNVHVVSGPALLAGAAVSAIERARYRPYMLDGVPVETETTITLMFRLN